ncbi:16S rRNA (cytidine(1402)-2'-O)-methyltransferase [Prosthecochloris sp. N3]|uniref:Ribosomal RNA small subunit methyltransferase I n=1 Tax=Prosthecochloris ethylica TaxID=2743976 RepID=A0ABR9XQ02_9CHLB|nr:MULTISPECIES: 16S rRNA (cytidine(1402)-2'-O)-methyltransferase [Prosthecochloris]MBF0586507.1 16S rRNA (cytidine(1402)-2'-O)-methyltransferase [Prosthecochloris ethylica]MBF0636120.1 16S rRNA (cytidine(1402)-2'-O)-methyltransferase [Prosthecochloris ethylica]NUK47743.1 16S rRNA (cytidine(1402)-2'-O)-methyltransferase [Prosthecochloris ethylica]RNA64404.1 16S rRNA (cytidine(1402)-2'-O)-methyltransferase [Prosthecochloris sp. ZM_2]
MTETGTLYSIATPLGNLDDITLRAIRTLQEVGTIACEDTRRTSVLLRHLGISGKRLISYHSANEERAVEQLIGRLLEGEHVALVTDAGTPAVSDPGFSLVRRAQAEGICTLPVPGASALTAALSVCPLPVSSFFFAGFLPHKKGRKSRLEYLAGLSTTIVLYESPYRLLRLLGEIGSLMPGAGIFIAREITKLHEEYITGTAEELAAHFSNKKIRGEFVVIVSPARP